MAAKHIKEANAAYEAWLRHALDGDIVEDDLAKKHEKMGESPFSFLRATYWRWAETILTIAPDLSQAPATLSIGDIHLENFGTWRDADGRLVWGVNDADEAAEMPYALDLVRLATSAALAQANSAAPPDPICTAILDGYRLGLADPCPFVLDEKHPRLRALVAVSDKERAKFWDKLDKLKVPKQAPPDHYRDVLNGAMPEPGLDISFRRRSAGTGSLGRPRWVGIAMWRGGRVIREAKALVASGWTRAQEAQEQAPGALRCKDIMFGPFRVADPWFDLSGEIAVRRLSPNNRKIEVDDTSGDLLDPHVLKAMGMEIANVHRNGGTSRAAIVSDLDGRPPDWLLTATRAAAAFVAAEFDEWRRG
jgi:hypothetical protein